MFLLLSIFANLLVFTIQDKDVADSISIIRQPCSIFEVWSDCALPYHLCGPHCPLPYFIRPICPKMCRLGCVCKPGFLRDIGTGRCVDERYCAAPGDKNVVYDRCTANEQVKCPVFLPFPVGPLPEDKKECNCDCIPGFVCKDGYAKNSTGYCIPYEECDNIKDPFAFIYG